MANEPIFAHRCAVPAPLRISPKPTSSYPGQPQTSPDPRATPCTLRSRLPGQPVFDPAAAAEGFKPESLRATNSKCSCPKSPASPIPSPLSPRMQGSFPGGFSGSSSSSSRRSSTTTTASRGPSLDFSSLFMRSETLRHELETCACHQGDATKSVGCPVSAAGSDRSFRTDSISSGYTSCYSN